MALARRHRRGALCLDAVDTKSHVEGMFVTGDDAKGHGKLREMREANDRLEKRLKDLTGLQCTLDGEADAFRDTLLKTVNAALSKRLDRHKAHCESSWTAYRGAEAKLAFARAAEGTEGANDEATHHQSDDDDRDASSHCASAASSSRLGRKRVRRWPTLEAHISIVFHSIWLICGRAIISRDKITAWLLSSRESHREHPR